MSYQLRSFSRVTPFSRLSGKDLKCCLLKNLPSLLYLDIKCVTSLSNPVSISPAGPIMIDALKARVMRIFRHSDIVS